MLYRHYEITGRRVVFAAQLGEDKNGKREVFYTAIDYTDEPTFDDDVTFQKAQEWLSGEMRDYGFIPLEEEPRLPDLEKQLKRAMLGNNAKRLQLMDQASKLVQTQGDVPNILFQRGWESGTKK